MIIGERWQSCPLDLRRGNDLNAIHLHVSNFFIRHELVEAPLDLDHSHLLMSVCEDVAQVFRVTTAVLDDANH